MYASSPLFSPKNKTDETPRKNRHHMSKSFYQYQTPYIDGTKSTQYTPSPQPFQKVETRPNLIRGNYFRQQITPIVHQHSPVRVLFKKGYEYQEEVKQLRNENQELKKLVNELKTQLEVYLGFEDVFKENREMKTELEKLKTKV